MKMWELASESEMKRWWTHRGGKREQRGGGETRGELKASHSLSSPAP